jgi:hypothetical protein
LRAMRLRHCEVAEDLVEMSFDASCLSETPEIERYLGSQRRHGRRVPTFSLA